MAWKMAVAECQPEKPLLCRHHASPEFENRYLYTLALSGV